MTHLRPAGYGGQADARPAGYGGQANAASRFDVAIVDYGAGNLTSVGQALAACGASPRIVATPEAVGRTPLLVVPGVGHFQLIARRLDARWRATVRAHVDAGGVLLGICLGMQWLFEGSDEAPGMPGLGVMPGRCRRLTGRVKIPHVGWNTLDDADDASRLLHDLPAGAAAYFTHGYSAPPCDFAVARTTHGETFPSAVERGAVIGTQFHPEKSGAVGLRMLRNVVDLARGDR